MEVHVALRKDFCSPSPRRMEKLTWGGRAVSYQGVDLLLKKQPLFSLSPSHTHTHPKKLEKEKKKRPKSRSAVEAGLWISLHYTRKAGRKPDPDCEGTNRVIWDHWRRIRLHLRTDSFKLTNARHKKSSLAARWCRRSDGVARSNASQSTSQFLRKLGQLSV